MNKRNISLIQVLHGKVHQQLYDCSVERRTNFLSNSIDDVIKLHSSSTNLRHIFRKLQNTMRSNFGLVIVANDNIYLAF